MKLNETEMMKWWNDENDEMMKWWNDENDEKTEKWKLNETKWKLMKPMKLND